MIKPDGWGGDDERFALKLKRWEEMTPEQRRRADFPLVALTVAYYLAIWAAFPVSLFITTPAQELAGDENHWWLSIFALACFAVIVGNYSTIAKSRVVRRSVRFEHLAWASSVPICLAIIEAFLIMWRVPLFEPANCSVPAVRDYA